MGPVAPFPPGLPVSQALRLDAVSGHLYLLLLLPGELCSEHLCGFYPFFCFLLKYCCYCSVAKSCPTLVTPWTRGSTRLLCAWDSPGKSTGVGCHFLLQGIFLTQELNPGLLHCRQILYHLSYEGSYFGQPLFLAPFSSELEKKKTTIGCCLSSLSISG